MLGRLLTLSFTKLPTVNGEGTLEHDSIYSATGPTLNQHRYHPSLLLPGLGSIWKQLDQTLVSFHVILLSAIRTHPNSQTAERYIYIYVISCAIHT